MTTLLLCQREYISRRDWTPRRDRILRRASMFRREWILNALGVIVLLAVGVVC